MGDQIKNLLNCTDHGLLHYRTACPKCGATFDRATGEWVKPALVRALETNNEQGSNQ